MRLELNPLVLPRHGRLTRAPFRRADAAKPGFWEKYDTHTLAYDVIHLPAARAVVLVCPKLVNLAAELRKATLRIDGSVVAITRIRRFRRYDEVWLDYSRADPERIEIDFGDFALKASISSQEGT
ncbi:MAG: hypothetical protein AAFY03_14270, partial [Pseudomonadota bacterium]